MARRLLRICFAVQVVLGTGLATNLLLLQPHSPRRDAGRATPVAAASAPTMPTQDARSNDQALDDSALVRAIQRELTLRGYATGTTEGRADVVTSAAILAFEHDRGMRLTAAPSANLLKAIILGQGAAGAGNVGPPEATAQALIRRVQKALVDLKFGTIAETGVQDEATVRAIRDFEKSQDLPQSGRVSGVLVGRLERVLGHGAVARLR